MQSGNIYRFKKAFTYFAKLILFFFFIWIFFLKGMYSTVVSFEEAKIYQLSYNIGENCLQS